MRYFWIGLLLACSQAMANAPAGRWYQVEVLIFEQPTSTAPNEEVFPLAPGRPTRKNTVELRPFHAGNQQEGFVILPENTWALQGMRKKVSKILVHTRWRQYLSGQSTSMPVHLTGGAHYSRDSLPDFSDLTPPSPAQDTIESSLGPYPFEVEGTLNIWLARYLHLEADFIFQKEDKGRRIAYRLIESRRMRSNEVHYLDHPKFGIIVLLHPEKETREEATEAPSVPEAPEEGA